MHEKVLEFFPQDNSIKTNEGDANTNGLSCALAFNSTGQLWRALFTLPKTPVKCAGAPQKIMYLFDDYLRRNGKRDSAEIHFMSAGEAIFGVPKYKKALSELVERRNIKTSFKRNLIAIDGEKKTATFEIIGSSETVVEKFDFIHVCPPMSAPDFIKSSPLANADGWIDVHKHSLQHMRFPNIFALGDASSLPTSRTGAAIRKQASVLVENLLAAMKHSPCHVLAWHDERPRLNRPLLKCFVHWHATPAAHRQVHPFQI